MKKKLVLGILAAVLSLGLGIGGTLMLFADTSTPASNIVTFGDLNIRAQEKGGLDPQAAYYDTYTDINGSFDGIRFDDLVLGSDGVDDQLSKSFRVVHDGGAPAYVRVKATLLVDEGSTGLDVIKVINPDMLTYLQSIAATAAVVDGWEFVQESDGVGYYYYVDETTGKLQSLSYTENATDDNNATPPIFESFGIPDLDYETILAWETNSTYPVKLSDHSLTVELVAQAVQSNYNYGDDNGALTNWSSYFTQLDFLN
jgi:predicted ribosomally synthesized peptide with SipW-like signal peptide